MSSVIVETTQVNKVYASGYRALSDVSLSINRGEILALLGPNGAGKTTLISIICGIVKMTSGRVLVNDFDIQKDFRSARSQIGLVPQELTLGLFDSVWDTICFSRGLYGKKHDAAYLNQLLVDLSLHDKKNAEIRSLSGGMKRRVLIAKALSHQPMILFLDEPTAGVDVGLRKDMWRIVEQLRQSGVTIILTTHYIEEAEAIADRVGVINQGKLVLVEEKKSMMSKLGKQRLTVELVSPLSQLPEFLSIHQLELSEDGYHLTRQCNGDGLEYDFNTLLKLLGQHNMAIKNLATSQSSLEDIFIDLVKENDSSTR